jgi:hypothetical protein
MTYQPIYRRDFKALANIRAAEAAALVRGHKPLGAFYLGGYAVECALKACIAKKTKRYEFPPPHSETQGIYIHDLRLLLRKAGLETQLDNDVRNNTALGANWNIVTGWSESKRYATTGLNGRDLLAAIVGPDGVLT